MRAARTPKLTNPRKTAFVPRSLFAGVLVTTSVIPLCACGGAVAGTTKDSGAADVIVAHTVAVRAFDASVGVRAFDGGFREDVLVQGVAACCFDASFGVALDAFAGGVADVGFSVAQMAFDASQGEHDATLPPSVACCAFDGGK